MSVRTNDGSRWFPTRTKRRSSQSYENPTSRRIVFLITMGIERPSGTRYFNIARELVRQGYLVRILALHPDFTACRERRFVRDGVEVWYVGQMHVQKRDGNSIRFGPWALLSVLMRSTLGMIWGVVCSPADVYHLGKPQPINGVAALIGVMLLRRKRFYVDCDDDEVASNHLTAIWQRWIFSFWQWLLPRMAIGVTVNTQFLADRTRRLHGPPVTYVPNGVDLERFRLPSTRKMSALRVGLGLEEHQVVAYVGTIAFKNHPVDLLLNAFVHIANELPQTVLLLIGGGEDVALMRQQVHNLGLERRVLFTGAIDPTLVPQFLALADVSVDPVRDDTVALARSPLKLFESLALGVPVVTGDVGDRGHCLAYGKAGQLIAPGDIDALAEGIKEVLLDQTRYDRLVHAGLLQVQQYSWKTLASIWKTIYRSQRAD